MKKIKILLIGYSSNKGGIETYLYNLIKNADRDMFSFDILCSSKNKIPQEEELKNMGVKIFRIVTRRENRKEHIKGIRKVLNNNYDYIHFNIMSYSWYEPIIEASKINSNIIIHSHSSGLSSYGILTNILHLFGEFKIRNINYIPIACSNRAGKFMFKNKKIIVCSNGIDINKFVYKNKKNKKIRKEFNISPDTFILGNVATFLPVKNHLFLVDLFYEYHKLNKNSKLLLVGDGPLKEKILSKVKKLEIEDSVIFTGIKDNVEEFYSVFDVFVFPSFSEGFGIVLLEAQTNGLKCYTSTNVSNEVNITGNVEFLSLKKTAKYWAQYIYHKNNIRDEKVLNNNLKVFDINESYKKIYNIYELNLRRNL